MSNLGKIKLAQDKSLNNNTFDPGIQNHRVSNNSFTSDFKINHTFSNSVNNTNSFGNSNNNYDSFVNSSNKFNTYLASSNNKINISGDSFNKSNTSGVQESICMVPGQQPGRQSSNPSGTILQPPQRKKAIYQVQHHFLRIFCFECKVLEQPMQAKIYEMYLLGSKNHIAIFPIEFYLQA